MHKVKVAVLTLTLLIAGLVRVVGAGQKPPENHLPASPKSSGHSSAKRSSANHLPVSLPPAVEVSDVDGAKVRPLPEKGGTMAVFFFIAHDCPISNAYAPEISRIAADYARKKYRFYVVYIEDDLKPKDAKKHATDYGFVCPALLDPKHLLVKRLKATITPEAVVVGEDGKTRYQGRIDDRYIDFGKMRHQAGIHDLRLALDALSANKPVPAAHTKAIGCFIPNAK